MGGLQGAASSAVGAAFVIAFGNILYKKAIYTIGPYTLLWRIYSRGTANFHLRQFLSSFSLSFSFSFSFFLFPFSFFLFPFSLFLVPCSLFLVPFSFSPPHPLIRVTKNKYRRDSWTIHSWSIYGRNRKLLLRNRGRRRFACHWYGHFIFCAKV
jgi:hypothetical protein